MSRTQAQVRHASIADLEAIVALERAIDLAPHWSLATYAAILESEVSTSLQIAGLRRCLFVASAESAPTNASGTVFGFAVGVVAASIGHGEVVAELESIAVTPSARRAGVGRRLCAVVIEWCRGQGATAIVLEVRADSAAAIALYISLGFIQTGRRPRYYQDPEDAALILRLSLD